MYDHSKQYRCTIIRGKSQKEMDDLLPAYAKVLHEVWPCSIDEWDEAFNNALKKYLPESNSSPSTPNGYEGCSYCFD